jgi:glycosyltransferase involved in cell wall biosynthesis
VIIATAESERSLVPTLAALVPGATAGLIAEVIVVDTGANDATAEVADVAGCRLIVSGDPLGARFAAAAATVRTPWLMFLHAGTVPEPGWVEAAEHFMSLGGGDRAAVFRPPGDEPAQPGLAEVISALRRMFGAQPSPEHGLLISKRHYDTLGGHAAHVDAEHALLRALGRRISLLPVRAGRYLT